MLCANVADRDHDLNLDRYRNAISDPNTHWVINPYPNQYRDRNEYVHGNSHFDTYIDGNCHQNADDHQYSYAHWSHRNTQSDSAVLCPIRMPRWSKLHRGWLSATDFDSYGERHANTDSKWDLNRNAYADQHRNGDTDVE